jgi:hypothetical protein
VASRRVRIGAVAAGVAVASKAAKATVAPGPIDQRRLNDALDAAYSDVRSDPTWIEHLRRYLGRALSEILGNLGSFTGAGSVVAWIIVGLLAIGAVLLIRRLAIVPERHRTRSTEAAKTPVDWARIADEALARGDLVGAIRARFRLLIVALSDRGVVVDEPSLTAGECRQAVQSAMPGAYLTVSRATEVFELAAYAHAALTTTDVDTLREAERVVRAA